MDQLSAGIKTLVFRIVLIVFLLEKEKKFFSNEYNNAQAKLRAEREKGERERMKKLVSIVLPIMGKDENNVHNRSRKSRKSRLTVQPLPLHLPPKWISL